MPTPVSALLHAATMVCSGVFVLVRSSFILEYTPSVLLTILWLAGLTTLVSGLIAVVTNDIKRVIALSTMSRLLARNYIIIILNNIFRNQTICVEIIYPPSLWEGVANIINSQITKTHNIIYLPNLLSTIWYYINNNFNNLMYIFTLAVKNIHYQSFSLYGQYFILYIPLLRRDIYMSEKWKIIIISKLVGISEAIRLVFITSFIIWISRFPFRDYFIYIYTSLLYIYILHYLIFIKKYINKISKPKLSTLSIRNKNYLNRISSPWEGRVLIIRKLSTLDKSQEENISLEEKDKDIISKDPFHEWLAGIIDGDGHFHLAKSGTARLNIVMDSRDKNLLYLIKHKFGGSIYPISNAKAVKYQLSHKKGLIKLINAINGNIRNPKRMLQVNKLCFKYDIKLIFPKPLTFNNGWYSGFIDSDGCISMNIKSGQIFLSVTQKDKYILEPLINIYSGRIRIISPKIEAFRHDIYRKNELFNLIDNYFNKYPLLSEKSKRLLLIKEFYLLYPYKDSKDINKLNEWLNFVKKWNKYGNE